MSYALRIYRRLALAFPHEFKLAYGADVMQLGEDTIDEVAKRQGVLGLVRLIADIAMQVAAEYVTEIRADWRYAARMLLKSPGFALVGILSIGLGIGLATNVYTTKWAMLFRDLPGAANAKRLVMPQASADGDIAPVSYYYVEQYREQKNLFDGVAAFQTGVPFNTNFQGDFKAKPERIFGQVVSPDYFAVLGVQAQRGRVFSAAVDKPGDAAVVVISDRFWRNRLNSSPDAIGQELRLNGQIATIVGITPKDFNGALAVNPAELFVPTTAAAALAPELGNNVLQNRQAKDFLAIMCLAPGVTVDKAEAGLDTVTKRLDAEDTTSFARMDKGRRIALLQAGTRVPIPRKMKPILITFFVALMGLVLTLACMNLANMLIARGANRRKEVAIRLTIGASRFRLIRQMMSEGILLSLLGGVAGFAIAEGLAVLTAHFLSPTAIPIETNFAMDWRAGLFSFGVAILCGVGFSLAPALHATKADLTPALKEGSAIRLPGYRRLGLRNSLMVGQVAASLMLLLMTGFLVIGIGKSSEIRTRFDARTMFMFSLDPVRDGYTAEKAEALFQKLPERLKASGAVSGVALAGQPPFSEGFYESTAVSTTDAGDAEPVRQQLAEEIVGAGYFASLDEPMLAGREFEERDGLGGTGARAANASGAGTNGITSGAAGNAYLPAVLSESAARKLFGNENAIGKHVRDDKQAYEVVGIVHDLKDISGISPSVVYLPLTRRDFARPPSGGMTVMVRSQAGADALGAIRNAMGNLDPNLNIFQMQTLSDYLDRSRAALQFSTQTYGAIGIFGLILAAIGLAGVTGYAVAQRRKEIAIRTALGASRAQVLRLVLREGTAMVIVGTALGFAGAMGIARILSALASMIGDALKVGTTDLRLLIGAPVLLALVALLACYVPARRSARIDPLVALREE